MLNLFRYVGLRHLRMRPGRTLLTTLGVSLGIALFIGIEIINRSTLSSFKENIDAVAGKAMLVVSSGETGFPESKLELIKKTPGVKYAVPMIESRGYFKVGAQGTESSTGLQRTESSAGSPSTESFAGSQSTESIMILGVDLLQEQAVRTYKTQDEQVVDDPLIFLNQPDSIIVTHSFAQAHHLKMDSVFHLSTAHGIQKFTVRGILSPAGPARAYGGALAIMDIDGARVTFGKEGKLDRVDIVPQNDTPVETVRENLQKTLGAGYQVERPETQSEGMERMVKSYQMMMSFFSSLALLVGLFLVTNSISISVAERKREIGTLRALGATRVGILGLFLSEAIAMGAVGGFVGAWMGRGLASVLVKLVTRAMSAQYLTYIEVSHLNFGVSVVLRAVEIGAFASFAAAAWPSFRATLIQPLEAMKPQNIGEEAGRTGFFKWSPILGFIMLVFVSISAWQQWSLKFPDLEILNQLFSVLGAALVGPRMVTFLIQLFRPLALPWGGMVTRLAQDNLIRNPRRTGSNVMSLMVGLILVILIACVNVSFKTTTLKWFQKILTADLIVSSSGRIISYQAQPLHESLGKELSEVPGVKKGPQTGAYGIRFVHLPYQDKQIALKAYDESDPELHHSSLDVLDRSAQEAGNELYHSADPTVLVSENFSLHFGKKTGDSIELGTPTGLVRFRIVGVMVDFASDVGVLYMNRSLYKKLWNDPLVNAFGIHLLPDTDANQVRKEVDRRFGQSKNLMVLSNTELKKQMVETIDQSFSNTYAIEGAALLVGLLGLLNTLLISVMERMRELGMLRAVGMSRRQMSGMILQEALFQGGLGALVAVLLGGWLAYVWITHSLSYVLGWIVHFYFPWGSVLLTLMTGLIVAGVAGVIPAKRAAYLEITEALEYE